jgi:LPXTG-site transpeptidase (sortase) family protein
MNEEARENLEQAYYEAVLGEGVLTVKRDVEMGKVVNDGGSAQAIGRITIPSLDIDYIILDHTTDKNLDISITKVVGPAIHEKGNLVLAGHNMKNGSLFGKLKKAKESEVIILEDVTGVERKYKIVDTYKVSETDLSPLSQANQAENIITLITCTERADERLIVVAKE